MKIGKLITVSFRLLIVGILMFSLVYPLALAGVGQIWPEKTRGSIVKHQGEKVGSLLIGQNFISNIYFHSRPSSKDYDGMSSGSANLAPGNPRVEKRVSRQLENLAVEADPGATVPVDMITESGSALDPHISPASAYFQVDRIASVTGISKEKLDDLIERHTRGRLLGIFGQRRVNVLKLNLKIVELMRE